MASKVPKFGAWEGGENFTVCFDNARKVKHNGPMMNPNDPQENPAMFSQDPPTHNRVGSQAKVPQFGAWDNGDNVGYTMFFDNARKNKNGGVEPISADPQLNHDVGAANKPRHEQGGKKEDGHLRNASRGSNASLAGSERQGRQAPGGHLPQHPKGGKSQPKPPNQVGQKTEKGATIPPFGVWNSDPKQAEGFTGTFERAFVQRNTPLHKQVPPSYHQQQAPKSRQEAKKGCCFPWF